MVWSTSHVANMCYLWRPEVLSGWLEGIILIGGGTHKALGLKPPPLLHSLISVHSRWSWIGLMGMIKIRSIQISWIALPGKINIIFPPLMILNIKYSQPCKTWIGEIWGLTSLRPYPVAFFFFSYRCVDTIYVVRGGLIINFFCL